MDRNKKLAWLLNVLWHEQIQSTFYCTCGTKYFGEEAMKSHISKFNPDYAADPRLVLREMEKRKDWPVFVKRIGARIEDRYTGQPPVDFVRADLILDNTGNLRDAAIEFLERVKG